MYRLELISQKELTDLLRRGIRTRISSITTQDGSTIKLLPGRPVIVSDEAVKLNPAILTDPTVKSLYIPERVKVVTETPVTIDIPIIVPKHTVEEVVSTDIPVTVQSTEQDNIDPQVLDGLVEEKVSDDDISAMLSVKTQQDVEETPQTTDTKRSRRRR